MATLIAKHDKADVVEDHAELSRREKSKSLEELMGLDLICSQSHKLFERERLLKDQTSLETFF